MKLVAIAAITFLQMWAMVIFVAAWFETDFTIRQRRQMWLLSALLLLGANGILVYGS